MEATSRGDRGTRTDIPVSSESGTSSDPHEVRWRTAFWSAVLLLPIVAMVFGANFWVFEYTRRRPVLAVLAVVAVVIVSVVGTWRRPRASGISLGVAAPILAGLIGWAVVAVVKMVTE